MKYINHYLIAAVFILVISCSPSMAEPPIEPHEDLRGVVLKMKGIDLSQHDLSNAELTKTTFDSFTPWPEAGQMPDGFNPDEVMEWGKYPGLGVEQLHEQGITGKGVHVAIIDQPLLRDHMEYREQLASYIEIETGNAGPQMHGPAVASLLVGKNCGIAPDAILHYWAEPSWKRDYQYRCEALEQIIEYNKEKPLSLQIRIVSISKGFSPDEPNIDRWKVLLEEAKQNGIYVIHCSRNMFGVGCPVYENSDDSGNFQLCAFYPNPVFQRPGMLFAPVDNRTTASSEGEEAYTFWSRGGLSWGAPYIAGVAALGLQIDPGLTEKQIEQLLYESGSDFQKGKLINPVGFIRAVQNLKSKS